jgi:hypothetical protein
MWLKSMKGMKKKTMNVECRGRRGGKRLSGIGGKDEVEGKERDKVNYEEGDEVEDR